MVTESHWCEAHSGGPSDEVLLCTRDPHSDGLHQYVGRFGADDGVVYATWADGEPFTITEAGRMRAAQT